MNELSDHAAGLEEVQDDLGDECPVFTWDGTDYKCLPGGARFKRANDFGGAALSSDLQLTCLVAQFGGAPPDPAKALIYRGQRFTVTSVTPAPGNFQMRINADLNVKGM